MEHKRGLGLGFESSRIMGVSLFVDWATLLHQLGLGHFALHKYRSKGDSSASSSCTQWVVGVVYRASAVVVCVCCGAAG